MSLRYLAHLIKSLSTISFAFLRLNSPSAVISKKYCCHLNCKSHSTSAQYSEAFIFTKQSFNWRPILNLIIAKCTAIKALSHSSCKKGCLYTFAVPQIHYHESRLKKTLKFFSQISKLWETCTRALGDLEVNQQCASSPALTDFKLQARTLTSSKIFDIGSKE